MDWRFASMGMLAGLLAGSFLATLVIRWGRGARVTRGRSACDRCGRSLSAWELIPLFSLLALRGRCRTCASAIDWRHPLMEVVCGFIGALSLGNQPDLGGLAGAVFGFLLAALALLDRDDFWLPDSLVFPLGLLGLASSRADAVPPAIDRLIGVAAGYVLLTVIGESYRRLRGREGLGGGDAKLLGAIGAWLGWRALPWVLMLAATLGLLVSGFVMLRGRRLSATDKLPLGTLLAIVAWPIWLLR